MNDLRKIELFRAYLQSFLYVSRQYLLAYGEVLVRVLRNKSSQLLESSQSDALFSEHNGDAK